MGEPQSIVVVDIAMGALQPDPVSFDLDGILLTRVMVLDVPMCCALGTWLNLLESKEYLSRKVFPVRKVIEMEGENEEEEDYDTSTGERKESSLHIPQRDQDKKGSSKRSSRDAAPKAIGAKRISFHLDPIIVHSAPMEVSFEVIPPTRPSSCVGHLFHLTARLQFVRDISPSRRFTTSHPWIRSCSLLSAAPGLLRVISLRSER
ncbi:hypothetical protein ACH5RR_009360 [Cinchona calisaya]|uniref:Uncharacterized protein n=1 Tax=Cinchona calisaya TaxID=153742 RepID=A0ABD3AET1_9GENT